MSFNANPPPSSQLDQDNTYNFSSGTLSTSETLLNKASTNPFSSSTSISQAIPIMRPLLWKNTTYVDDSNLQHFAITERCILQLLDSGEIFQYPSLSEAACQKVSESSICWIDLQSPSKEDLMQLQTMLQIHPLTIEDIELEEECGEKIEYFGHYSFLSLRFLSEEDTQGWFYTIFSESFVVTIHNESYLRRGEIFSRVSRLKEIIELAPEWVVYCFIDNIVDNFLPIINSIQVEVDSVDDLVLILREKESEDLLVRIGLCRRRATLAHRLLSAKPEIVKTFYKIASGKPSFNDLQWYITDIQDHVVNMMQSLQHCEKSISRAHSTYLARINLELTQASSKMNDVAGRLTVLATVLVPMNLITGLWGMNVKVPGQDRPEWFFGIVTFILAASLLMVYYSRKRQIL